MRTFVPWAATHAGPITAPSVITVSASQIVPIFRFVMAGPPTSLRFLSGAPPRSD